MKGALEVMRWMDPIENFVREHGHKAPRWAIITTYTFDPERFSRSVVPVLSRRGRAFRVMVLADARQLAAKGGLRIPPEGAVNIHGARMNGYACFHPKVAFLRAGNSVLACFGSANLTDGGFGGNLEMWTYSSEAVITEAIADFLSRVVDSPSLQFDAAAKRGIRRALTGVACRESPRVWHSLGESFHSRVERGLEARTRKVTVVSPHFAKAKGLQQARKMIGTRELAWYSDRCPPGRDPSVRVYSPTRTADADGPDEASPGSLHAKAYIFHKADRSAAAWMGSANFTGQALTKTVAGGGNVELLVRTDLPADDVRGLEADLGRFFAMPGKGVASSISSEDAPIDNVLPRVLGGEISCGPSGLQLRLSCADGAATVVIEGPTGNRLAVRFVRGRAMIRDADLVRIVGNIQADHAQVVVFHECRGKERIPVVVNIAHVPPVEGDVASPYSLDQLLDDLRGHVRVGRSPASGGAEIDDEVEGESDNELPVDDLDVSKRLDEVRHQGELDQLAVKAALAIKLARRCSNSKECRDAMLEQARDAVIAACPPELRGRMQHLLSRQCRAKGGRK